MIFESDSGFYTFEHSQTVGSSTSFARENVPFPRISPHFHAVTGHGGQESLAHPTHVARPAPFLLRPIPVSWYSLEYASGGVRGAHMWMLTSPPVRAAQTAHLTPRLLLPRGRRPRFAAATWRWWRLETLSVHAYPLAKGLKCDLGHGAPTLTQLLSRGPG